MVLMSANSEFQFMKFYYVMTTTSSLKLFKLERYRCID